MVNMLCIKKLNNINFLISFSNYNKKHNDYNKLF